MKRAVPVFAALGHQENWQQSLALVQGLRPPTLPPLTLEELRSILPWIPPRVVSRFHFTGSRGGAGLSGVYIDTFITCEQLAGRPSRQMLQAVRDGLAVAEREGAHIATLGGFTSILFESERLPPPSRLAVTTGNSLTAALIVHGVQRALRLLGRSLDDEDALVLGASGDVGSACARWLSGRVRHLTLVARNADRLQREAELLSGIGSTSWSTDLSASLGKASLVVAAASASLAFDPASCRPDAIICDAGYPKNMTSAAEPGGARLFWGGMGLMTGGFQSEDGLLELFYDFPAPGIAHGCILEGAVLALAGRHEAFSRGRGQIQPPQIDEIWSLARQQSIEVAPLFNHCGLWPEERATVCSTLSNRAA
jgi:predicted amino acid dehydrogenase